MQPLKLVIHGKYWDSYIYSGTLYLFELDGSICSLNWDNLIGTWDISEKLRISLECAFLRSDYLYSSDVQRLLRDADIKSVVQRKFQRLSQMSLIITDKLLKKHCKKRQDNRLLFPHADLEIYNNNLYVGSASGLVRATCNRKGERYPISTRPEKRWDGPALGLSASYNSLAIAAGNEGLLEMELGHGREVNRQSKPIPVCPQQCRDCGWTYWSVFASSDNSGFLAEYTRDDKRNWRHTTREFKGTESAEEIFGSQGYAWGAKEKLCQATQGAIKVMKYSPYMSEPEETIRHIGDIPLECSNGGIISASTANFGVIVELEKAIMVLTSSEHTITLPGEVVNWRVFPRSHHYENQLHLVYEDRVEILSFNEDYLVDQEAKIVGTSFPKPIGRRWSSENDTVEFVI